ERPHEVPELLLTSPHPEQELRGLLHGRRLLVEAQRRLVVLLLLGCVRVLEPLPGQRDLLIALRAGGGSAERGCQKERQAHPLALAAARSHRRRRSIPHPRVRKSI